MSTNGDSPEYGNVFERLNRLETLVNQIQETQGKMGEALGDLRVSLARIEATQEATNKLLETLIQQVAENTRQIAECNRRIDVTNERIDATNERIGATNLRIDTTNERIDTVIEGNAQSSNAINQRINDTNGRIDRLLYALWGVGAVGFGALAAAFLEFFTR